MSHSKTLPALPVPEEEIIDLVTSLPASATCATDAEHAIEEKLSVDPDTAHPIVETLIQQRAIEGRTATAEEVAPDQGGAPNDSSALPYKLVRTGKKRSDE